MPTLFLRFLWLGRFVAVALAQRSIAFLRFQPGYHGSTIPSAKYIQANRERIFDAPVVEDGIRYNREEQKALLRDLSSYYADFSPPESPDGKALYHYANNMFPHSDAAILYGMLRHFKPRRVIEVGSGFSSALMLDTAAQHPAQTDFTFIDPYSNNIVEVQKRLPRGALNLIRTDVQDVDPAIFKQLQSGDILFLDTSHAVKIGSDVSTHLFSILPALNPGVIIHIHDIYFWEYPEDFVMAGRTYNETYFLRAFLQYNSAFEILLHTAQMQRESPELFAEHFPGFFKPGQESTQSLWLRKLE